MPQLIPKVKGTRDFYPEDWAYQKWLCEKFIGVGNLFGYREYESTILEYMALYLGKSSEEIVTQQTFTLSDRDDKQLVMRPETHAHTRAHGRPKRRRTHLSHSLAILRSVLPLRASPTRARTFLLPMEHRRARQRQLSGRRRNHHHSLHAIQTPPSHPPTRHHQGQ